MKKSMTFLKQNWVKMSLIVLLLILVFSVREYLLDKNEIYAESEYFECETRDYPGRLPRLCEDIKTYKIKSNR